MPNAGVMSSGWHDGGTRDDMALNSDCRCGCFFLSYFLHWRKLVGILSAFLPCIFFRFFIRWFNIVCCCGSFFSLLVN